MIKKIKAISLHPLEGSWSILQSQEAKFDAPAGSLASYTVLQNIKAAFPNSLLQPVEFDLLIISMWFYCLILYAGKEHVMSSTWITWLVNPTFQDGVRSPIAPVGVPVRYRIHAQTCSVSPLIFLLHQMLQSANIYEIQSIFRELQNCTTFNFHIWMKKKKISKLEVVY